jgi:hypothetical protein
MAARRREDVPTVGSDVESQTEPAGAVRDAQTAGVEVVVRSPAPGVHRGLCDPEQPMQRVRAMREVDIDHDKSRRPAGADGDVRIRAGSPPSLDLRRVRGGIVQAASGGGVLGR